MINPPDFIGIGAARCATTWTAMCLQEHPRIYMARGDGKTYFFNRYYKESLKDYEKFFADAPAGSVRGELTETYFFNDEVPYRIAQHFKDIKVFVTLRNPVERAFSTYLHMVRDGFVKPGRFEHEIESKAKVFIRDNMYYDRIKPYFDLLPKENIHVRLYEDIRNDPLNYIQSLYEFIGVDSEFVPSNLELRINPSIAPRHPRLNKFMAICGWYMRDMGMEKLRYKLRSSAMMRSLRFKESDQPKLKVDPGTQEKLQHVFHEQNVKLGKLIERDLSAWL